VEALKITDCMQMVVSGANIDETRKACPRDHILGVNPRRRDGNNGFFATVIGGVAAGILWSETT
jgi:hypothetical protein